MSLFWFQPNIEEFPHSHECWTSNPNAALQSSKPIKSELIGYVDLMYTTIERNKYIGSFEMADHSEQEEMDDYFFSVEEAKAHVESEYMAWRMIGTLIRVEK